MASINLTGVLRDPTGEFAYLNKIRFTHTTTTGQTLKGFRSVHVIDDDGAYDIDIEYGNVFIESQDALNRNWIDQGTLTINSETPATDLPSLLGITTPATDADLLVFQALVADAEKARDESVEAKDISTASSEIAMKSFSNKDLMIASDLINDGDFVRAGVSSEYRDYKAYSTEQKDSDVLLDSGLYASPIKNRIAVLGDSISQSSYGRSDDWVSEVKKKIELTNTPAEIKNFSVGGATLSSAITSTNAIGGLTMMEALNAWDPDDVIVALGFNDCITGTIDEATAEARVDAIVDALREERGRRIVFVKQVIWDKTAGTPTTGVYGWKNQNVIPLQHTVEDDAIVKDEHLELLVTEAKIDKYATLNHMHDYMAIVAQGSKIAIAEYDMDIWKCARLGWHTDGLHPDRNAHRAYAAIMAKNLEVPMLQGDYDGLTSNKSGTGIFDFELWWSDQMIATDNGFDRVYRFDDGGSLGHWGSYFTDDMVCNQKNWYFPQKNLSVYIQRTAYNADSPVSIIMKGVPSRTTVVGFWKDQGGFFDNGLIDYDSNLAGDSGSFIYTFIPSILFEGNMSVAGTYKLGVRIQNSNMGKATYYMFYSDLVIVN